MNNFREEVFDYLSLQSELLVGLLGERINQGAGEILALAETPSHVLVRGQRWQVSVHGVGVRFKGPRGVSVDAHRGVFVPELVDCWRLQEYFKSKSIKCSRESIQSGLSDLVDSGDLEYVAELDAYLPSS